MKPALLLLLALAVLATPASARIAGEPASLRLAPVELLPRRAPLLVELGVARPLDLGGGDGVVSGPLRTLGWIALALGGGSMAVGATAFQRGDGEGGGVQLALLGGGLALSLAGLGIIWSTGCVSCASCGIVDNTPHEPPPARDAYAGLDRKRKPDGVRKVTVLSLAF